MIFPYFAAAAVPAAFMLSVQVYKIWYITTALCCAGLACAFVLDKDRWSIARNFFRDGVGVLVYSAVMLASGLCNLTPQSTYALLTDSIFPVVFAIFYYVGLKSSAVDITKAMRLLVWPALIAMLIFWDESAIRQGYRVIAILPFAAPFMVLALYQGSLLAGLELGLAIVSLTVTMSRTPLAAAVIGAVASLILLARSTRSFTLSTAQVAAWVVLLFVCVHGVPTVSAKITTAADRISSAQIPLVADEKPDSDYERTYITEAYWKLLPSAGLLGIGYGNFINHYSKERPDRPAFVLHNIYQVWTLEGGIFGALSAAFMLGLFYLAMFRYFQSGDLEQSQFALALGISITTILAAGVFHQMHQAPMLFAVMGIGLGSYRKEWRNPVVA